jgi:hypothetical protein
VAFQILNSKRAVMHQIEGETGKTIIIRGNSSFVSDQVEYVCEDGRGQPVTLPTTPQSPVDFRRRSGEV